MSKTDHTPLEDVQDALLDRVHAGDEIDREAVVAEHPEHSDALRRFFALLDEIEPPVAAAGPAHTRLGEFRLLREIGRGGMGVVHEAEQTSLKRRVALKVLPALLASNERLVARFRREAEAAGRLRHPNIVPVYAVGDEGGVPFFAMELVDGRSLADVITKREAGDPTGLPRAGAPWRRWVCATLAAVADALEYAHQQGILHRDVKPGNILLEKDGTPRLTDFGLALDLDAPGLTASGETFGTPLYMSPEQAIRRETPLDRRTDVYSLGVTLYETLVLRSPYQGTSTHEILSALHTGTIVAPRKVDPEMPAALEAVILRALAKSPAGRHETAGELAADLRAMFAERPAAAAAPTAPAAPTSRGHAPYLLAGAVVVLGLLATALWLNGRDADRGASDETNTTAGARVESWDGVFVGDPAAEHLLRDALEIGVEMRSVVARQQPATLRFNTSFDAGQVPGIGDLVMFTTCDVQIEGSPWRTFRYKIDAPGPLGNGSGSSGIKLTELLGDALEADSVAVGLRLTTRAVRRPDSMAPFAGGGDHIDRPQEWVAEGGTLHTWEHYQTVLIYDEFPADYPEAVSGRESDAAMRQSLLPEAIESLSIGASRRFSLDFSGVDRAGPLATACEVDLCRADSDEVIATAVFTRPASSAEDASEEVYLVNESFWFRSPPAPGEQRFALDVAARRLSHAKLVFRGSRRVALEHTSADSYWAGSFEVTLPVHSYAPSTGNLDEAGFPDEAATLGLGQTAHPGEAPWPDAALLTQADFEKLVDGTHPDGAAALAAWLHARPRMRSLVARDTFRSSVTLQARHGRVLPDAGAGRGAALHATWEMSVDDGLDWTELGTAQCRVTDGDPLVFSTRDPIGMHLGAAAARDEVDIRFRVNAWLVHPPKWVPNERQPGDEEWAAIQGNGTRCSIEFDRTIRLCERYPATYPAAIEDPASFAAVSTWLKPKSVRWDGLGTSFLDAFGHFTLEVELPGDAPVPMALEVEVWDPVTGRQVGTSEGVLFHPDTPRRWPWQVGVKVLVGDPPSKEDAALAEAILNGKQPQLRLVFRGSRLVALEDSEFAADRYWKGEIDLLVPVKAR